MSEARLVEVNSGPALDEVRRLFREYADSLDFSLCFQNFDAELQSLPSPYQRIFICEQEGKPAGCIALKDLGRGICEMKRLYVRPEFRGRKIGRLLAEHLVEEARAMSFSAMRLDTIRGKMDGAIALYASLGFREITAYYDNPVPNAYFMELGLQPRLAHGQCEAFFRFFCPALSTSLMGPITEYAARESGPLALALNSWVEAMTRNLPPDEALLRMRPRFPQTAEVLLIEGCESGMLDFAVGDINDVYAAHPDDAGRDSALVKLAAAYHARPKLTSICATCVEREIEKLWRRARSEGAREVVLEQEGDRFLHEVFLAIKVVRISEPSRAMVFAALLERLDSAAEAGTLELSGARWNVARADGAYRLEMDNGTLLVSVAAKPKS